MKDAVRRRMSIAVLLFVAFVLIAAQPTQLSANTVYPCKGAWNGTMGPGTGTVSVLGANQKISTNSIVNGTFDGDTTHGNIAGTITTTYTVSSVGAKGQVTSTITGAYAMSIDANGTITGTSTIPLSGGFSGEVKITLHGQLSPTGQMTGTWTGTLTVTQVTYMGMQLGANISAPGSGQFTGSEQTTTG